jgi:hypothetical protein
MTGYGIAAVGKRHRILLGPNPKGSSILGVRAISVECDPRAAV